MKSGISDNKRNAEQCIDLFCAARGKATGGRCSRRENSHTREGGVLGGLALQYHHEYKNRSHLFYMSLPGEDSAGREFI